MTKKRKPTHKKRVPPKRKKGPVVEDPVSDEESIESDRQEEDIESDSEPPGMQRVEVLREGKRLADRWAESLDPGYCPLKVVIGKARVVRKLSLEEVAARFLQELRQEAGLGGGHAGLFLDYSGSVDNMVAGHAWTHIEDFTLGRPEGSPEYQELCRRKGLHGVEARRLFLD